MGSLCGLFLVLYVVLNLVLTRTVIKPVTDLSLAADRVSTGDFGVAEFPEGRRDEIGRLAVSFNRMRRSLEQAIKMIEAREIGMIELVGRTIIGSIVFIDIVRYSEATDSLQLAMKGG